MIVANVRLESILVLVTGKTDTERRRARESAQKKEYYLRNKERILSANKAWREANIEKAAETGRKWREANAERVAKNKKSYFERNKDAILYREKERRANLSDGMVKERFCDSKAGAGLSRKDIPAEMIPLIRASMLITRELKGVNKKS